MPPDRGQRVDPEQLRPEHRELMTKKLQSVAKLREAQAQISVAKAEIAKLDQELFRAGLAVDIVVCW